MCYEFEQYWVEKAKQADREAKRREEERARREEKKELAPDGVKDPEPVPV
jgi:hypothetical protein